MDWTNVDAIRIMEECNSLHADMGDHCEQWNRRCGDVWEHYEECAWGPIDGRRDAQYHDLDVVGNDLDSDDHAAEVLAAMQREAL